MAFIRRVRTTSSGLAAAGLVAIAFTIAAGGCGSSGHGTAVGTSGSSTTGATAVSATTRPASPTTVAGQLPTVPNCGGGAYKPQTLLIVCGNDTTMATGVAWDAWGRTSASGAGTVHLVVAGHAATGAAHLVLDTVSTGPVGPQFSRLTVTWSGQSPDGHAQDTYRLSPGA
jgi:hypothetical protein